MLDPEAYNLEFPDVLNSMWHNRPARSASRSRSIWGEMLTPCARALGKWRRCPNSVEASGVFYSRHAPNLSFQ